MPMKLEGKSGLAVRLVLAAAVLLYLGFAGRDLVAHTLGSQANVQLWQVARTIDPGNAQWWWQLAQYAALQDTDPAKAAADLEQAVARNPHEARYWLELASIYQQLGRTQDQGRAFDAALKADPKTPSLAWQAANFYLVAGATDKALSAFGMALQNDVSYREEAMHLVWQTSPDVDRILREAIPPDPVLYQMLLVSLISDKQDGAARQVWTRLMQLRQPLELKKVSFYVRYLVQQGDAAGAMEAWRELVPLCGLNNYIPTENLVINGGFDMRLLNDGFDWHYDKQTHADLALDASDFRSASRSMSVTFDGLRVGEIGIEQWVPVQPDATYDFSVQFKTEQMEGAGGPAFLVQDQQSAEVYFTSPLLVGSEIWREVTGSFRTGKAAKMVSLRLVRTPANNAIKGKLWVDDVQITRHNAVTSVAGNPPGAFAKGVTR